MRIRRDLDQHRCRSGLPAHAGPRIHHPLQEIVEHLSLLQLAQTRGVGRGDIDGEVAHDRRKGFDQSHVICDAVGAFLVGADIDPDDAAFACTAGETAQHRVGALAVETQTIDHAVVAIEPKEPGPRIPDLCQGSDRPDLNEAKTELEESVRHLGVLIEAGRHADRIGKIEPERSDSEPRIVGGELHEWRKFQGLNGNAVRILGVEHAQQGPRKQFQQADHGASSGKTCRRSLPRGSGFAHSTAPKGSVP